MSTKSYDAVAIGAGMGGYVAAIRLAQMGKKVALVEKEPTLGGVCLNWGCIPSKALIAAANLVDDLRGAAHRGIVAEPKVDVARLREFKGEVVKKLTGGVALLQKGNGVEVLKGTASFVAPGAIEVAGKEGTVRVEAGAFVLATGARPVEIPGFPFGGEIWSARDALELTEVPKRLAVIGGGVIGLELGTVYAKLGSQVTVVEALPQLLTGVDPDAVRLVAKGLRQRGVKVLLGAKAKGLGKKSGSLVLVTEVEGKEEPVECDKVLVAVGFRPFTQGLGLDKAGVKLSEKGFVEVDEQYRTSVPTIYAVGDLTGAPFLAHKAAKEGEIAADAIAGKKTVRDWVAMPAGIFTDPEIGTVGLSEEQAKAAGYDPIVGKFGYGALGRAIAIDHTEGFVKVIADRASKLLLGAVFVGHESADLVAEAALALEMAATLEDVALTVHAHPTLPEAFQEACMAAMGEAVHMLNRPERPKKG
ncbi:MAG: dihydrolipoyl dehydrogenase [Deltaproteobacteria bacterium]|nr:dihydrolipoyl dehydrogenase [Deltaproteobacteria bacterium]